MTFDKDGLRVISKRCSVTAFDMHVQVHRDGRERGIWIFLNDESADRVKTHEKWVAGAVDEACKIMGMDGNQTVRFKAWMALDRDLPRLMSGRIHEGALLEWPEIQQVHAALGKELAKWNTSAKSKSSSRSPRTKTTTKTRSSKRKAKRATRSSHE